MRVFVLSTGRCGSTTFARACQHLTNFTVGHESRAHVIGLADRLDYPDDHIEVDNRLSWFLSPLADRYPDAFWVHLIRDPDAVVASFLRRWDKSRSNIIRGFARGILIHPDPNFGDEQKATVCRMYVDTVTETISSFLSSRAHTTVAVETAGTDFPNFVDRIGARGDLAAALTEWQVHHNAGDDQRVASPRS